MTSVTTKTPAGRQRADDPGRVLLDALTSTPNLVAVSLLTVAFVAAFWHFLFTQGRHSWGNHDWNHSYVVPLISMWLMWQHRNEMASIRPTVFWPGLAPLLLGLASYPTFAFVIQNHMGQGYALVLALFGMVLLLTGPRLMKFLFLPIGYLVLAVTLPDMWMSDITFRLRQLAATGGYVLLQVLGTEAELKGSVLEITNSAGVKTPLEVADACSGMSMVIAFLALGTAMALAGLKEWWQRVVLVMLAVPVALLLNVLRIAVLGLAVQVNPDLAAGQAHMFIGMLLLVPGLFMYLFIRWALVKSVSVGAGASGMTPTPSPSQREGDRKGTPTPSPSQREGDRKGTPISQREGDRK